jgi:hypothetical protein
MDRLGDGLDRILGRLGGSGEAPVASTLVSRWPELVGEAIARNAWPARVGRDGTLHVNTSSSAWAFELTQLRPTILARLQAELAGDAPKGLRFAPGPLPEPSTPDPRTVAPPPPVPSPEQHAQAAEAASAIEDPELRGLVARAAAQSLATAASSRSE